MFDSLRKEWHQFHKASPGQRFTELHRRHAARRGLVRTILLLIGGVLIAVGLATLFIPPIPGITLVLLGALFWAQASERAARMGDKIELGIRKGWRRLRS
ncbi:MAG: hypothetical protein Q7L19_17850 [Pseudohongiella sp.]|nr:hypothetical protein [Pseudohongiella sp.]